jgi:hypothetical protein
VLGVPGEKRTLLEDLLVMVFTVKVEKRMLQLLFLEKVF